MRANWTRGTKRLVSTASAVNTRGAGKTVCGSYLHRSSTYTLRSANVYLYNTDNGKRTLSGVYRIR
ncbi:MAG TPA: hypothetical protein VGL05_02500 [Kribbella sp.]